MRVASIVIVMAVALGGCTAILGLDKVSSIDRDNDNVPDAIDNCPDDSNPDQSDFDHNGKGDVCDLCTDGGADDVDMDGIPDGCDGCIGRGEDMDMDGIDDGCDACIGNGADVDHDGIDDACDVCIGSGMDVDHDNIDDKCDTCIQIFVDADGDMVDDGCDPCVGPPGDEDGDGVQDACDPCVLGPQHDEDGDGTFDACDNCDVIPNPGQADFDNDGLGDACEQPALNTTSESSDMFVAQDPNWWVSGIGQIYGADVLRIQAPSVGSYRWREIASYGFVVETRLSFEPSLPIVNQGAAAIANDSVSTSSTRALECRVSPAGNIELNVRLSTTVKTQAAGKQLDPTKQPFRLRLVVDDLSKTATCLGADSTNEFSTGPLDIDANVLWLAGIAAFGVTAEFEHYNLTTVTP